MNKPQQPDKSLEQKIRGIIGDALASSCTREECPVAEMNCVECAVKDVLALLQPQQPAIDIVALSWARCNCGHSMMTHRDGDGCCDRSMCNCKKFEPQQPEELVKSDIYRHSCITPYPALVMAKCHACVWDEATLAQLAHDKQRTVSIDWLFESCPHSEPLALVTRHECDECMEELSSQGQRGKEKAKHG